MEAVDANQKDQLTDINDQQRKQPRRRSNRLTQSAELVYQKLY